MILLGIGAWTAAAHSALLRLNKGRLRFLASEGMPRARSLLSLAEQIPSLEVSLAAANLVSIALIGADVAAMLLGYVGFRQVDTYVIAAGALVVLIWVQIAAQAVGSAMPEETLYFLRWPLRALDLLLKPAILLFRGSTRLILPVDRDAFFAVAPTDEDRRMIADAVEEESSLEEDEKEMIHSIFEMGERTAREILIPRVDVVAVEATEPLRQVLEVVKERGHSRVPIYDDSIDNIVGIVYAKDLLRHMETGSLDEKASTLARPAYFIPESKKIDELLHEMQRHKVHMAIVVDEYGGTAGLVTIEDLLEEIVGEINDEYDVEEKTIERLGDREAVFDARVSIHDVKEALGILDGDEELSNVLDGGEFDTVGGLVYDRLGKIPVVGDEIRIDAMSLQVLSTIGKRIKKVKIRVEAAPSGGERGRDN